jgi:hypothetical protein
VVAAALAAVATIAGAAGMTARRRRTSARRPTMRCECGQDYRFSGEGRHRIVWPAGAGEADALLTGACIRCGRELALT